jgi:parvulin-like peptidyl-prolyl isomerase
MKRLFTTSLLLLSLPLVVPRAAAAQTILVDRIVARVNDRMATLSDFERQLDDRKQQLIADQSMTDAQKQEALASIGRTTFADLYEELLLLSRADQLNAHIADSDVQKAIAQTRDRMGLKTDEQFRQALASSGMTEDVLRDRTRRNLLVQEVMGREVQPRLKIDEEELRRFYREHPDDFTDPAALRLIDVVVLDAPATPAAQTETAAAVAERLRAKASPQDATKAGTNASQVVDLGWVQSGDLDADIEKAVWALQPGEVTNPVRGRGGLHVVRVEERRAPKVRPFDEVKESIQQRLEQERMGAEYRKYLRELEQRSYIALTLPPEAEGFKGLAEGATTDNPFGDKLGDVPAPTGPTPAKQGGPSNGTAAHGGPSKAPAAPAPAAAQTPAAKPAATPPPPPGTPHGSSR